MSFTASAGIDLHAGISRAPDYRDVRADGPALVASADGLAGGVTLRLSPAGLPLRHEPKASAGSPATVERSIKGQPAAPVAPSLSRRGLELARGFRPIADRVMFARDEVVLPPTVLMPGGTAGPDWEASRGLEPWTDDRPTTTRNASSVQSPAAAAAGSTGAARGPARRSTDGATPATPRAVALASTTPAPADSAPIQVAAAPVSTPTTTALRPEAGSQPRYSDLIASGNLEREQRCLAEAVYFEARSEPEAGQAAVAQVVLNRVKSGLYPASVCGVVYQNRHRYMACQFSFACEGKSLRITDSDSWETAKRVARDVTEGRTYLSEVGGSTHYHADYVSPGWARRLKKMDVIGRHVFYQLRPGQT